MAETEYPGYKYCFIDIETTGTDRKLHNIFQISGAITGPNLTILERFDFRFCPISLEHIEDSASEITGMTREKLKALPMSALEAYNGLCKVLGRHCNKFDKKDKLQMVAYNAPFDSDFLREFFAKNGDVYFGSWFWTPPICVMQAAAWLVQRVRGALVNFKLGTLCQSAGIKWNDDDAHDALYDIKKTIELFKYIRDFTPSL